MTEDFIYVEQEWGSLFYKHIGKQKRLDAKNLCSTLSPDEAKIQVHLPIPRFKEENEFYKTHFGDKGLWLDVSYYTNEGLRSFDGHLFIRFVRTFIADKYYRRIEYPNIGYNSTASLLDGDDSTVDNEQFVKIINHNWIDLTDMNSGYFIGSRDEKYVYMTDSGAWEWINENDEYDAVCVFNIIPDECSECSEESFCRYTDSGRKKTECVCQQMTEGKNCEIDLCSHCQNGGFCEINIPPDGTNPGHHEIKCICPYPFHGDYCEGTNRTNIIHES